MIENLWYLKKMCFLYNETVELKSSKEKLNLLLNVTLKKKHMQFIKSPHEAGWEASKKGQILIRNIIKNWKI